MSKHLEYIRVRMSKLGKVPQFDKTPGWGWQEPKKVSSLCTSCGSSRDVWCIYAAESNVDGEDDFYHLCLECGHEENWLGGNTGTCPKCTTKKWNF